MDAQLGSRVLEFPAAEISQEGVASEIIGNDDVLASIAIEVGVGYGLGPAGAGGTAASRHVFEPHASKVSKDLVGASVSGVAFHGGEDAVEIIPEMTDVEVEQTVAVEVEGCGWAGHHPFAQ